MDGDAPRDTVRNAPLRLARADGAPPLALELRHQGRDKPWIVFAPDGRDVGVTARELMSFTRFRRIVEDEFDVALAPMSRPKWLRALARATRIMKEGAA